jgi:hypothetical protein
MGYLTFYAYGKGNVNKILAPVYYDQDGNPKFCGEEDDFKTNRYLYFTDLGPSKLMGLFKGGVCVDKCPTLVSGGDGTTAPVYEPTTIPCDSKYQVKCNANEQKAGSFKVRPTIRLLTYCVPDFSHAPKNIFTPENLKTWNLLWDEFKNSSAGSYIYDLYLSSRAIWSCVALAPIWCFIFIAIMSAFAETIAWICVALAQLGLIAAAVVCYLYRGQLEETF